MRYYKIICNYEFIGIGTSYDLRRFQTKHSILLVCDEELAQYIQCNDVLYHSPDWMKSPTTNIYPYYQANVLEIDENEYNILLDAIESGEEVPVDEPDNNEPDVPIIDENGALTLEYVRNAKIAEMSRTCEHAIEDGFDLVLDDHEEHHFSLTTQDQLNLITLSTQLASGETAIPYHADGELCRFFTPNEVQDLIETATIHKTYHVTYFNALRAYIEQLETIEEIQAVTYGMYLAEEYQSDVMKQLFSV